MAPYSSIMKDIQLRLSTSTPRRGLRKASLTCRTWKPQIRPKTLPNPFPTSLTTQYISAVQVSKTDKAYSEVAGRPCIRTDKESKRTEEGVCVCRKAYLKSDLMFKCEGYCAQWYHPRCLGMQEDEIERHCRTRERWYCHHCFSLANSLLKCCRF